MAAPSVLGNTVKVNYIRVTFQARGKIFQIRLNHGRFDTEEELEGLESHDTLAKLGREE